MKNTLNIVIITLKRVITKSPIEIILTGVICIITAINHIYPFSGQPVKVSVSEIKPLTDSPVSMRLYPPLKPHIESRGLAHTEPIPFKLSTDTIQEIKDTLYINDCSKTK